MLLKLDDAPDSQIPQLPQQYISLSEADHAIQQAIVAQLDNAPLRLINTSTGRLCDRGAQINAFMRSMEYKELSSSMTHLSVQTEPIREVITKYFSWVMLSHTWNNEEPLLRDVQDNDVYTLNPIGVVKLQKFCKLAHDLGYRWAWVDTCCIDQSNNVELQQSVNSMFVWYRRSALTVVYLSDVLSSSQPGALARSLWNVRGWTIQELLAPKILLFYQADWTPYLNIRSSNHKGSVTIMQELEDSTGINAQALVAFYPGMRDAREKLQWASCRVTTLQEDIAYSLFGIFGVHLPVIYGEKKQNALGRLLQEIIARSGDISALDWIGQSSEFNSCLPADITSYTAPSCTLPSLSEDDIQKSVSTLRDVVAMEWVSKLYTLLDNLSAPRFANSRLQLPCITFPVTEIRRNNDAGFFTYNVKADGLQDLLITTEDRLVQFSPTRRTRQSFLLIRPWNRYDLELPDFDDLNFDDLEALGSESGSSSEPDMRDLRLIVRLGQPFGALLLVQQWGGEFKRIASDNNIIAQVKDATSVDSMMDVRTLEIL
ncbi:heterokaryon incompatibility protein-domain-containing protein [Suillus plorans]|uniref:Heterokaryon incompatibility protein-domain-containing protein n=1 Tax=Suillus plorans TaxID=116603 RepID=A0A9P7ABC9_9AGAM|nr:heterokaryon incompatibility protein-domain-containing protein [Suillus plorans]KAG1785872.1 heterokaryon incompatibility protein-domain-containing protein [Suillus plorans]